MQQFVLSLHDDIRSSHETHGNNLCVSRRVNILWRAPDPTDLRPPASRLVDQASSSVPPLCNHCAMLLLPT